MARIRRTLVALSCLTVAAGTLAFGAPAGAEQREPASALPGDVLSADLLPPDLRAATGPVQVMLELDAAPASTAYAKAQGLGARAAGRAAQAQVQRVEAQQATVVAQLRSPATRATVLYTASRVYSGVAVSTDASRLPALAALPGVRAIHRLVPKTRANFVTIPLIKAPESWTATGQTGQGVTLGIIDTGIDYTHADFGGPGTTSAYDAALAAKEAGESPVYPDPAKVAGGTDFVGNAYDAATPDHDVPQPDNNPLDCGGHGTHVAGTSGGYGVTGDGSTYDGPWNASTPFDTMKIGPGVAPAVTLYALKVFGCEGSTNVVAEALDWAADPNGDGDLSDHLDVVNMSLGSSFGSPDDPDAVATNNAVDVGINVAASAGNEGDLYEVSGSPGNAAKAIGVAASDDNGDITDGVALTVGGTTTNYPSLQSDLYPWTTEPGVTNGAVVTIGDWSQAPSDDNNTDGCSDLSAADAAAIAGKVVALMWDSNDTQRRCGSAGRSDRVAGAGATGAILASDQARLTVGVYGSAAIPVMIANSQATSAITAASGSPMTATLTNALHNSIENIFTGPDDPTDQIADFTSRGIAMAGNVKPDVSAPGSTIFSAAVGTGDQGFSASGTSMAAPHVAGLASLMVQAHPAWTPMEIKAGIVNTANHDLFLDPARSGPRYDALRVGSGRIDAQQAVDSQAVAYVPADPGAVNVSFGVMNIKGVTSKTKTVRIADKRTAGSAMQYALSVQMINKLYGATYTVSPTSISLQPGKTADVTVTVTVDPEKLRHKADPTIDLDPLGVGIGRAFLTDVSGLLNVAPATGPSLRVALFAAPRPASAMSGGPNVTLRGSKGTESGTLRLTGATVAGGDETSYTGEFARVTALQLTGQSPEAPKCEGDVTVDCVPYADAAAADLKYVGYTSTAPVVAAAGSDPLAADSPALAYFGIASWGFWRTAADVVLFGISLDTDNDGAVDALVINSRLASDIFVSETLDLRDPDNIGVIDQQLINNVDAATDLHLLHGNVMTMPVSLASLAHPVDLDGNERPPFIQPGKTAFSYWIESVAPDSEFGDAVGSDAAPMHADFALPALTVFDSAGEPTALDQPDVSMSVTAQTSAISGTPKILLLHHLNVLAKMAEVVPVRLSSQTSLSVTPTDIRKGSSATATVRVTDAVGSGGPGGKVEVYDGAKLIATRSIPSGTATVTISGLTVGVHRIQAQYSGSSRYAPSRSRVVQVTVTG